ncbi:hypothetical protein evm_006443 [Chilo suppressalis]|nr:hypothetical protein evm_006443 [Chilo suppressalis]
MDDRGMEHFQIPTYLFTPLAQRHEVWADWKSKTKKKGLIIRSHARGTGGGPASRQILSALDERVLAIMGPLAVEGQASVQELGFNKSQSAAPTQLSPPIIQDNPIYLEIVNETPDLPTSPQPSTSSQSEAPSRPRVLAAPSSQAGFSGRPPPSPPVTPAPLLLRGGGGHLPPAHLLLSRLPGVVRG